MRAPKTTKKPRKTRVKCPTQRCRRPTYREGQCGNLCRTHLTDKLDTIARRQVLERDGDKCVRCGSLRVIQWSHFPSRRYHWTRWRLEGAVAHCSQCHILLTYDPLAHEAHMLDFWKEPMLDAIKLRAREDEEKLDLTDVADYLMGKPDTIYGRPIVPLVSPPEDA